MASAANRRFDLSLGSSSTKSRPTTWLRESNRLIQFGSGMDVLVGPEWDLQVCEGMHVTAGSSVLDLRSGLKSAPKASAQMSGLEPMACRG